MYTKDEATEKLEREIEEACKQNDTYKILELGNQYTHPSLSLNGLISISPDVAKALVSIKMPYSHDIANPNYNPDFRWALYLNGLTSLSLEVAEALVGWPGLQITFSGLTAISPEVAQVLAKFKGNISSSPGVEALIENAKKEN